LKNYYWKGNIRELRNVIERAMLLMEEDEFRERHISFIAEQTKESVELADKFVFKIPPGGVKANVVIKTLILQTLKITNGNQVRAAKLLGLSRSKLRYRMEQLGIEVTKNIGE